MKNKIGKIATVAILILLIGMMMAPTVAGKGEKWNTMGNTADSTYKLGTLNSEDLRFITNDEQRMVITSSGLVGIGVATPTEKLDVDGNIHASGSFISGSSTTYGDGYIGLSPGVNLDIDSGTLYVDSTNDRVGIGTTSPSGKLEVVGDIVVSGLVDGVDIDVEIAALHATDSTLQANIDVEEAARIAADVLLQNNINAEEAARIAADIALQANIDAEEAARIVANIALQNNIDAEEAARIAADVVLQANIDDEVIARQDADQQLQNNIDAEEAARIAADVVLQNNIDVEVAARIAADIVLQANINAEEAGRIASDAVLQSNIDAEETSRQAADHTLQNNIDNLAAIDALDYDSLANLEAAVANGFNIATTSGNVGIGIVSPTEKLHVDGNVRISGALYDSNNQAGTSGQILHSTGTGIDWVDTSTLSDGDWTVSGSDMYSAVSGNVGIGTTSPQAKLDVELPSGPMGTIGGAATIGSSGNSATGDYAIAMGFDTDASGRYSTAMGYLTTANDWFSTAMGYNTVANNFYSTAMGSGTIASGGTSTAMGHSTTASGQYSTAMGYSTEASGNGATAMGYGTSASGFGSTAMGTVTTASKDFSTAMGYGIITNGRYSFGIGLDSTFPNPKWTISQDNIMAIMGGKVGIGDTDPDFKLEVAVSSDKGYLGVSSVANNDGDIFIIDSSGNIGIGSTSPGAKLDVRPGATDNGIQVRQPVGPYSGNFLQVVDSTSQYRWRIDTAFTMYLTNGLSTDVVKIGDVGDIYFNNGGNVGIGTTTPGAKLDVEVSSGGAATIGHDSNSATGNYAIAMGYDTDASGDWSIAVGSLTTATSYASTAMGYETTASGSYSTAMGYRTTASGTASTAIGYGTIASRDYSTAMGFETTANGWASTTIGSTINADGQNSVGIGLDLTEGWTITQDHTMAIMGGDVGIGTVSPGAKLDVELSGTPGSVGGAATIGYSGNSATGDYAIAMGVWTTASGGTSTAMGRTTTASGENSIAMGTGTIASGSHSTAMGSTITAEAEYSIGIGLDSIYPNWQITQDNTMAIMGGNVGIGTVNPDYKLSIGDGTNERLHFSGSTSPSNPPSGSVVIYFDGTDLFAKNSGGTVVTIADFP
jgi:hypothetical protein